MADLAARVGSDEKRLSRTIVRINTIEVDVAARDRRARRRKLAAGRARPVRADSPDAAYEKLETRDRVRAAIQSLPWRERKVIGLYYYGEVTMKQIGAEIGVNESRVSQLHARAIRRLREALGGMNPQQVAEFARSSSRSRRVRRTKPLTGETGNRGRAAVQDREADAGAGDARPRAPRATRPNVAAAR